MVIARARGDTNENARIATDPRALPRPACLQPPPWQRPGIYTLLCCLCPGLIFPPVLIVDALLFAADQNSAARFLGPPPAALRGHLASSRPCPVHTHLKPSFTPRGARGARTSPNPSRTNFLDHAAHCTSTHVQALLWWTPPATSRTAVRRRRLLHLSRVSPARALPLLL